jgi:hypothetical protein
MRKIVVIPSSFFGQWLGQWLETINLSALDRFLER